MRYPNAAKGLQTIVIAEIIAAAASILALILSVLTLPNIEAAKAEYNEFGTVSIVSVVMLIIVVMYVVSFILEIIGIVNASKDEPSFKVSLYAIIAAIILTILSGIFYQNETVFLLLSIGGDVAQFFLVHYVIHGIMHLSNHLGRPEVSKNGKKIFTIIYIGIVFEVIVRVFDIIYGHKRGEEIAIPFVVIANILKSAEYILFLIYIVKGTKMLKESDAESE